MSLVPRAPYLLFHCAFRSLTAGPAPRTEPPYYSRRERGREAHPDRKKDGLVDRVREHKHGIQPLVPAGARRCALDLIPARLCGGGVQEPGDGLFRVCGGAGHLLRAEEVDADKGDGEVERGEDEVHAEGVPAVRFDEVFETLGDGCVRGDDGAGVLGEAGRGCAEVSARCGQEGGVDSEETGKDSS